MRGSDEKRGEKKKQREGTLKFDFSAVGEGRRYLSAADEKNNCRLNFGQRETVGLIRGFAID